MKVFILIMTLYRADAAAVTTQEFNGEQNCKHAGQAWVADIRKRNMKILPTAEWVCVVK